MNHESTYYLIAAVTASVLALQLTGFWWKNHKSQPIGLWVLAFWGLALADLLFLLANSWADFPRWIPRVLVTAAYAVFLLGAQRTAGSKPSTWLALALSAGYAACLILVFEGGTHDLLRIVLSRSLWAGCCIAAALYLRKAGPPYYGHLGAPATILFLQGCYIFLRVLAVTFLPAELLGSVSAFLTYLDYIDTALFDVALCVALLLALVEARNTEILASQAEVQKLTNFLPVCAWCRQVRDDEGYWHEVMDYVTTKSRFTVTHGICAACESKLARK